MNRMQLHNRHIAFGMIAVAIYVFCSPTHAAQVVVTPGMLSYFDLQGFDATLLVDGNTGSHGFHTDSADPGAWLKIDFGLGNEQMLTQWEYNTTSGVSTVWDIQYSDDDSSWADAFTGLSIAGAGWNGATWSSVGFHRYWRSIKTDPAIVGGYHNELRVTPEPSTFLLAAFGIAALAAFGWRRWKR